MQIIINQMNTSKLTAAESKAAEEVLKVLREGGVILCPTDTVWGLSCDASNPSAVARIYEIKRRQDSKSLVLLASDLDQVAKFVDVIPPMAIDLVEVNDKPMTIVYPGAKAQPAPAEGEEPKSDRFHLAHNVVAADGSVGIRIPMMEFCRQIALKLGRPIVSTSANISGEPSPKKYSDIPEEIRAAVDYAVPSAIAASSTGHPSQIIKIEIDGQFEIIRA